MSIYNPPNPNHFVIRFHDNTDINATLVEDIGLGGPIYLTAIEFTNGAAAVTHLCLYDAATATVGTTAPNEVYCLPASTSKDTILFEEFDEQEDADGNTILVRLPGAYFDRLSVAAKQEAGTAGTSNPASTCSIKITYFRANELQIDF